MLTQEEQFGKKLAELRKQHGWTLRKAALAIGISHMRLGELEIGRSRSTGNPTRPTRDLVGKIAQVYGVPKDYLLERAGYAREHPTLTDQDALMLDRFHALDDPHRTMALEILRVLGSS